MKPHQGEPGKEGTLQSEKNYQGKKEATYERGHQIWKPTDWQKNEDLCLELAAKDAALGDGAMFPMTGAKKIANGEVLPLGVQFQNTVNAERQVYEK